MKPSYLFAGAAAALVATAAMAADAPAKPDASTRSETIVRTVRDGQAHETRIERDASGRVIVTRDGKVTTAVDPHEIALAAVRRHRDPAEHLRNALQLRPNQEAALQAYLAATEPSEHNVMVFRSGDRDEATTTPERLAQMEKMLAEHESRMKARIAAIRTFYDQLDPAQKKAFDELAIGDGHMRMVRNVRFVHPPGAPGAHMTPPMPVPPLPPPPPEPPSL